MKNVNIVEEKGKTEMEIETKDKNFTLNQEEATTEIRNNKNAT